MLTDDEIKDAIRPLYKHPKLFDTVMESYMDDFRAVEAALLKKLEAENAKLRKALQICKDEAGVPENVWEAPRAALGETK